MNKLHCDLCDKILDNRKIFANVHRRQHLYLQVGSDESGQTIDICKECIGQLFFNVLSSEPKTKKVN